jgi:CO/xanthine dehydrogenase FAD-binding subunit
MPRWTLPDFTYLETESIAETLSAMKENPGAVLKAGGTDLLVRMRRRAESGARHQHSAHEGTGRDHGWTDR